MAHARQMLQARDVLASELTGKPGWLSGWVRVGVSPALAGRWCASLGCGCTRATPTCTSTSAPMTAWPTWPATASTLPCAPGHAGRLAGGPPDRGLMAHPCAPARPTWPATACHPGWPTCAAPPDCQQREPVTQPLGTDPGGRCRQKNDGNGKDSGSASGVHGIWMVQATPAATTAQPPLALVLHGVGMARPATWGPPPPPAAHCAGAGRGVRSSSACPSTP